MPQGPDLRTGQRPTSLASSSITADLALSISWKNRPLPPLPPKPYERASSPAHPKLEDPNLHTTTTTPDSGNMKTLSEFLTLLISAIIINASFYIHNHNTYTLKA